ncbi:NAD(P)H-binding protein [Furfurilactobacillus sp.]|uniref:NAD(P)H-binding protein n=1 Tax=Furfurilactobacillus sp. TaxID=2767911 RepID=UPI00338E1550
MANVLIIGATGSIGQVTRQYFLEHTDDQLTLMARNVGRLGKLNDQRERAIQGNVTDTQILNDALQNQDVVFAALSGNLPEMATAICQKWQRQLCQRWIVPMLAAYYSLRRWESTMRSQLASAQTVTLNIIRCCKHIGMLPILLRHLI